MATVAKQWYTGQTTLISFDLFDVNLEGDYRISLYTVTNTTANAGSLYHHVSWSDPISSEGLAGVTVPYTQGYAENVVYAHCAAGSVIHVQMFGTAPPAGSTFDLYAVVESIPNPIGF